MIVDIDGTVALRGDREPYDWGRVGEDRPNTPIITVIQAVQRQYGYRIIFTSGRKRQCHKATVDWIREHMGVEQPVLFMRSDNDNDPDFEVKRRMFTDGIYPVWGNPVLVFDDRDQVVRMWRELGFTCLQVADGNF